MPIDPTTIGATSTPIELSWTSKDCLLYALATGAGSIDAVNDELEFTTENSLGRPQRVLPTFAVVAAAKATAQAVELIGPFDLANLVHGAQQVTLHKPIPVEGTVRAVSTITAIYDKQKAAVVVAETAAIDLSDGSPMFTLGASLFIRGEGGWGGDRGPSATVAIPERPADRELVLHTRPDQALLYRLTGDRNPLHSDPEFAKAAGFPGPILHGLCTYGFIGRGLLRALCDSEPDRFRAMSGRFSAPVIPGDTLVVSIWESDPGQAFFRASADPSEHVVLDTGVFEFDAP